MSGGIIQFKFPVTPTPKGRHRTTMNKKTGVVRSYKPEKTRKFENYIKYASRKQYKGDFLLGPIVVEMWFYMLKPKTSKNEYPIVKPDLTNLAKSVEDGLNLIAYKDDSQIVDEHLYKRYTTEEKAYILVTIGKLNEDPVESI